MRVRVGSESRWEDGDIVTEPTPSGSRGLWGDRRGRGAWGSAVPGTSEDKSPSRGRRSVRGRSRRRS